MSEDCKTIYLSKHEIIIDSDYYDKLLLDSTKMDFIRNHGVTMCPETTYWFDTNNDRYMPDYHVSIDNITFYGQSLDEALINAMKNECQYCNKIYEHAPGCINET